ncbi:unnamed protein product [Microthlaspi erraticum]|uniref:Uncharacterized protein n=1 Tax=Microthlaspi erraticum TaxID=1685480 RepID=A0A6D2LCZ4_9BRAS|nr:unnamed protein product [Microthlaspi erraticum]
MLRNAEGTWLTDTQALESMAVEYYRRLYSLEDVDQIVEKLSPEGFMELTQREIGILNAPSTEEEIATAVRAMGRFKAPGPDSYRPVFYQRCWEEVGGSVTRFVLDFFRTGVLLPNTNDAIVVLLA